MYHDAVFIMPHVGERQILSLITKCDNEPNGCEWAGELRSLDEHLARCGFTLLLCPNKCQKADKMVKVLRKDLERHSEECPRRLYKCRHCQEVGEYEERTTTHLDECPLIEVPCPKRRCIASIARRDLSKHREECLFEQVSCKYASIGCKEQILRKDQEEHEADSQQHIKLAIDSFHQQQIRIREQERMLAHLRSREMPILYKFTSYNKHRRNDDKIYSPAFYTEPGGYKLCISVCANGSGDGKNVAISVYVYLMKGENDDHLPWPFTGKVTLELLNQLQDENHHSRKVTFTLDKPCSQRVINEDSSSLGWGLRSYIPHSDLDYNPAKNCQYLKDDCLYFRISVDAEGSTKPWLIQQMDGIH